MKKSHMTRRKSCCFSDFIDNSEMTAFLHRSLLSVT